MERSDKKIKYIEAYIPKPLRWSKAFGVGWNSRWMDISTARLLAFTKHLNEKGIDQVRAEAQARRLEQLRHHNKPALEAIFGDEEETEPIGWEGAYLGRLWQFNRETNTTIKGLNKKRSKGDNFITTASTKGR